MDYVLTKFRIKQGKLQEFKKMLNDHNARRDEIVEGLQLGKITLECLFIESSKEGDFFFVFKKGADEGRVREQMKTPSLPGDVRAKRLMEQYLEDRVDMKAIATFDLAP